MPTEKLSTIACEVLALLKQTGQRLVCAESCTAGLVSATLAGIPGASNSFCGSAVVYRNATKSGWLGVPPAVLDDPTRGDVCEETAILMAQGVLAMTPEASVSVSVTGHLGPGSPPGLDGAVDIGWAVRDPTRSTPLIVLSQRVQLEEPAPVDAQDIASRVARQTEATLRVLLYVREALRELVP